jgi:predicted P-loop ATPase
MKKGDVLRLSNLLKGLEQEYFKTSTKIEFSRALFHGISRNIPKLKEVEKELEEIHATIQKDYKKEFPFDEQNQDESYINAINEDFDKFKMSDDIIKLLKDFNDEEVDISFYKVSQEELDEAILPSDVKEILQIIVES